MNKSACLHAEVESYGQYFQHNDGWEDSYFNGQTLLVYVDSIIAW